MKISVLIVAAGRGSRCGTELPKQYHRIRSKMLLRHTIEAFLKHPKTTEIICVIHPDDQDLYKEAIDGLSIPFVFGGKTRQESVRNGLAFLKKESPDLVFIHDAARPNLTGSKIDALLKAFETKETEGCILALPVTDTVKYVENGYITKTIPRAQIYRAQTPQVFRFETILECHKAAPHDLFTDDAAIAEYFHKKVKIIIGSEENIKVTTQDDFQKIGLTS